MTEESLYTVSATVRIRKGQGRSLKSGGAWVYDNEIEAIEGSFENGGLVNVEDFDGYPLGCGFINTRSHITGPHAFPEEKPGDQSGNFSECGLKMPGNTAKPQ